MLRENTALVGLKAAALAALVLFVALSDIPTPLIRNVRKVSFSALQSDGSLQGKTLKLETFWNRRRLSSSLKRRDLPPPLVRQVRDISFLALQPDGALHTKRLALETYWSDQDGHQWKPSTSGIAETVDRDLKQQGSTFMVDEMPSRALLEEEWKESVQPEENMTGGSDGGVSSSGSTFVVLSIILVSISSVVLVCSALLYATDVYDRYKYRMDWQAFAHKKLPGESPSSGPQEPYDDHPPRKEGDVENALFMIRDDRCAVLSRVSSMTNSLADLDLAYVDDNGGQEGPEGTLELKGHHRLATGENLEAIVEMAQSKLEEDESKKDVVSEDRKVDSSAGIRSKTPSDVSSGMLNKVVASRLESETVSVHDDKMKVPPPALEKKKHQLCRPKTPELVVVEERDAVQSRPDGRDIAVRAGVDEEDTDRPPDVPSEILGTTTHESVSYSHTDESHSFVRDICFVWGHSQTESSPSAPLSHLGLELEDAVCPASYPRIQRILIDSPLVDRLFEGDFIIGMNEMETSGLTARQVYDLSSQIKDKMIKLTVMSTQSDDVDSETTASENGCEEAVFNAESCVEGSAVEV